MKFEDKRVGYGRPNPMIAKGAKGYFSDYMSSLERYVRNDRKNDQYMELQSTEFGDDNPYEDQKGTCWKFFYVVEEAGGLLPLSNKDLHALLGTTITNAVTGDNCVVATYIESYKDSNASVVLSSPCGIRHTNPLPAMYLLRDYRYENGGIIGKPSVNKCNDEE